MYKYSPFYQDPKYEHDVTKLSDQALEERLIFLNIVMSDPRTETATMIDLRRYAARYQKEWERRRLETNNNNN